MYQKTGKIAETKVSSFLRQHEYKVIKQNWRRRDAEIDIVALKDTEIFFVEVKFRQHFEQGEGYEYVNKAKQAQLRYAAIRFLAEETNFRRYQPRLVVASVFGVNYEIEFFDIESF